MNNLLILGADQNSRLDHALKIAQGALCIEGTSKRPCFTCSSCYRVEAKCHPNVFFIEPKSMSSNQDIEKKNQALEQVGSIKAEQVRFIVTECQKTNFENGPGIFIITHAHLATKSAANSLLKAIEESCGNKIFMALAPSRRAVLPTIASRMICSRVKPSPLDDISIDETISQEIFIICRTKPSDRIDLCEQFPGSDRETITDKLNALVHTCHTLLRRGQIEKLLAMEVLSALNKAEACLKKNLSPRLVWEFLLLRQWPYSPT